jgi:hypothetical protein
LALYTVKTDDVMCDMFVLLLYVRVLKIPKIYTGTILIKCFPYITPTSSIYRFHAILRKDGSGAGSCRISVVFGSSGFGFGVWFSPTVFRVQIPES